MMVSKTSQRITATRASPRMASQGIGAPCAGSCGGSQSERSSSVPDSAWLRTLACEAHAAEERGETRVAAQRIEPGIHPGGRHSIGTREKSAIEPVESLVFLAEFGVDGGDIESTNIAVSSERFDACHQRARGVFSSRHGERGSNLRQNNRGFGVSEGAIGGSDGLLLTAEGCVRERDDVIIVAHFLRGGDGIAVTAREEFEPRQVSMRERQKRIEGVGALKFLDALIGAATDHQEIFGIVGMGLRQAGIKCEGLLEFAFREGPVPIEDKRDGAERGMSLSDGVIQLNGFQ